MTLQLVFNGRREQFNLENPDLATWLTAAGYGDEFFAVAVNRTFVPRSQYHSVLLNDGDEIDVVFPMQGG